MTEPRILVQNRVIVGPFDARQSMAAIKLIREDICAKAIEECEATPIVTFIATVKKEAAFFYKFMVEFPL